MFQLSGPHLRDLLCRSIVLALLTTSLFTSTPVSAQSLDQYGGYVDLPMPGGATGYFRVEKVGTRWVFVSPAGNAFWLRAVQVADPNQSAAYVSAVIAKYGDKTVVWARQTATRMLRWGFNALGQLFTPRMSPVGMLFAPGNSVKLPIIRHVGVTNAAYNNGTVKNLIAGTNPATYTGYRGRMLDAADPGYATYITTLAVQYLSEWTEADITTSPWLLGASADDADYMHGFKAGDHAHPGWIVAVTAPTQTTNPFSGAPYTDPTVYSKLALRDFLKSQYGNSVSALNAAWGSTYTTFDSAGGWGTGTGLLDEDGSHPWLHTTDVVGLSTLPAQVRADLNAFLETLADTLFGAWATALRTAHPHQLIFGPNALQAKNRPEVLRAASRHFDALLMSSNLAQINELAAAYNILQKPVFLWVGITAQADSPWAGSPGPVTDQPTQAARGQYYANYLSALLNLQGSDGVYPVIGIDWWAWGDFPPRENTNWGLVTLRDNAYDGKEAVRARGVDPPKYPTGAETKDYGDFLTRVVQANRSVGSVLNAQLRRHPRVKSCGGRIRVEFTSLPSVP